LKRLITYDRANLQSLAQQIVQLRGNAGQHLQTALKRVCLNKAQDATLYWSRLRKEKRSARDVTEG
jgi:hypothetical protein